MFIAFDGRASPLTRELILEPAVTVRLVENSKSKAGRDERPLPTVSQHLKCLNWIASAWIDMSGQESHLSAAGHRRHSCRSMTNHVWNSSLMDRRRVSALNPCWRLIHFDSFWFILIHFDSFWFILIWRFWRGRPLSFDYILCRVVSSMMGRSWDWFPSSLKLERGPGLRCWICVCSSFCRGLDVLVFWVMAELDATIRWISIIKQIH